MTCLLVIILFFIATPAYANVGLPMIALTLPGMLMALIPVIFIEANVYSQKLSIPYSKSLKLASISNLLSTLIGMPVTWGILLIPWFAFGGIYYVFDQLLGIDLNSLFNIDSAPFRVAGTILSITLGAAWLSPIVEKNLWMLPSATLFLLIPFFYASWLIEYKMIKRLLTSHDSKLIKTAVLRANVITYIFLALAVLALWFLKVFPER